MRHLKTAGALAALTLCLAGCGNKTTTDDAEDAATTAADTGMAPATPDATATGSVGSATDAAGSTDSMGTATSGAAAGAASTPTTAAGTATGTPGRP